MSDRIAVTDLAEGHRLVLRSPMRGGAELGFSAGLIGFALVTYLARVLAAPSDELTRNLLAFAASMLVLLASLGGAFLYFRSRPRIDELVVTRDKVSHTARIGRKVLGEREIPLESIEEMHVGPDGAPPSLLGNLGGNRHHAVLILAEGRTRFVGERLSTEDAEAALVALRDALDAARKA